MFFEEAFDGLLRELDKGSEELLFFLDEWLELLSIRGDFAKGEAMLREVLEGLRDTLGDQDPTTLRWGMRLGGVLLRQGKFAEARPLLEKTLTGLRDQLGDQHQDTFLHLNHWFDLLVEQGSLAENEQVFHELLVVSRNIFGGEHTRTLGSMLLVAQVLHKLERWTEAEALLRELPLMAADDPTAAHCESCLIGVPTNLLGDCLAAQGRREEAEPLLLEGYAIIEARHGTNHRTTRRALKRVIDLYEAWGKHEEVALWKAKVTPEKDQ